MTQGLSDTRWWASLISYSNLNIGISTNNLVQDHETGLKLFENRKQLIWYLATLMKCTVNQRLLVSANTEFLCDVIFVTSFFMT